MNICNFFRNSTIQNVFKIMDLAGGTVIPGLITRSFLDCLPVVNTPISYGISFLCFHKKIKITELASLDTLNHIGGAVVLKLGIYAATGVTEDNLNALVATCLGISYCVCKKNILTFSSITSQIPATYNVLSNATKQTYQTTSEGVRRIVDLASEILYASVLGGMGGSIALGVDSFNQGEDSLEKGLLKVIRGAYHGAIVGTVAVIAPKIYRLVKNTH